MLVKRRCSSKITCVMDNEGLFMPSLEQQIEYKIDTLHIIIKEIKLNVLFT